MKRNWAPWIMWGIWIAGGIASVWFLSHTNRTHNLVHTVLKPQTLASGGAATNDICHHAVTCGGVHDLAALQSYPGFDIRTAREHALPYDIWGYVAYRKDGKIYYTRKEREVPKGTLVWEDAFGHMILARCGNMVIQSPITDSSPTIEPADIFPPVAPDIDFGAPTVEIPTNGIPPLSPPTTPTPPTSGIPPSIPPTYSTPCCGSVPPSTPRVNVAEPNSGLLVLVGFAVLLVWSRIRRGRMERREFPRYPGKIKQIEDVTYATLREHHLEEPAAKCTECGGTPVEEGAKCDPCVNL